MTHYTRQGTVYRVTKQQDLDITNHLPAGTYIIKQDQFGNMFLDKIEDFNLPEKLYGDCTRNADRILNYLFAILDLLPDDLLRYPNCRSTLA